MRFLKLSLIVCLDWEPVNETWEKGCKNILFEV